MAQGKLGFLYCEKTGLISIKRERFDINQTCLFSRSGTRLSSKPVRFDELMLGAPSLEAFAINKFHLLQGVNYWTNISATFYVCMSIDAFSLDIFIHFMNIQCTLLLQTSVTSGDRCQ